MRRQRKICGWEVEMYLAHLGKLCQGFHGILSSGMTFWLTAQLEFALEGLYGLDPQLEQTVLLLFRSRTILSRRELCPRSQTGRMDFSGELHLTASQWKEMLSIAWNSSSTNKLETDFTRSHVNRWYQIQVAKITITSSHFTFCLFCMCVCASAPEKQIMTQEVELIKL